MNQLTVAPDLLPWLWRPSPAGPFFIILVSKSLLSRSISRTRWLENVKLDRVPFLKLKLNLIKINWSCTNFLELTVSASERKLLPKLRGTNGNHNFDCRLSPHSCSRFPTNSSTHSQQNQSFSCLNCFQCCSFQDSQTQLLKSDSSKE